ncbi:MAG: transposase [Candidatus Pacearchaeota archaeon]
MLIVLKDYNRKSLRGAEVRLSEQVCRERVDHSVIAYWENKEEILLAVAQIIAIAGALLDRLLSTMFSVIDSTKFTSWNIEEAEIFVCNKIAKRTVYPVGISFNNESVASPVDEAVPPAPPTKEKLLYGDAWFDNNEAIGILFRKGYTPIICPNKNRWRGYYRKKARRLYRMPEHRLGYRQRGRGESLFGSLTNSYRDRFKTRNITVTRARIASRVLCYQIRLLLRAETNLLLIVRHTPAFYIDNCKIAAKQRGL